MKKFLKEIFNLESIKNCLLIAGLADNPDPIVLKYLAEINAGEADIKKAA